MKWQYAAIGNIVRSHVDENGVLRHGAAAFSGGTKVYLAGRYWTPESKTIQALGLSRGKTYQVNSVPVELIDNVRCQRVFHPRVLEIMNDWECWTDWWKNTPEDKEEVASFVENWKAAYGETPDWKPRQQWKKE